MHAFAPAGIRLHFCGPSGLARRAGQRCSAPRRVPTRAAAGEEGGMPNPFKNDKRDAARRALEGALSGQKDILADLDRVRQSGGGGSGGDGGGSGGSGGWWKKDDDGKSKKEAMTTLTAFAYIVGVVLVLTCWKPMLALVVNIIYMIFRLPTELPEDERQDPNATAEEDVMKRLAQD